MRANNTLAITGTPFLWASWLILSHYSEVTVALCAHSPEQSMEMEWFYCLGLMILIHGPTTASSQR